MEWSRVFVEAIGSLEPRMDLAMQADGCRENWLQTEIMMFAANRNLAVWTNSEPIFLPAGTISSNGKHDLAAYDDGSAATMVAEVKVMAGHFQKKCLVGARTGLVPKLVPQKGQKRYVSREEIMAAGHQEWGLIPDAARLLRHPCKNKYLILVLLKLHVEEDESERVKSRKNELHAAMNGVTFVKSLSRESVEHFDNCTVKVWSL